MYNLPGKHDFAMISNEAFVRLIQWKDSDGNPVDLTGYSAVMTLRHRRGFSTHIARWTSSDRISFTTGQGLIKISVPKTVVQLLSFSRCYYDLVMTATGAEPLNLLEGYVTYTVGITT